MPSPSIRCREIESTDLDPIATLLFEGFRPQHRRPFWVAALDKLRHRSLPDGVPRYGMMLEADGQPVGVLLLLYALVEGRLRCNVSSWYVQPDFRAYGAMLVSRALRRRDVTYTNLTPAPHTWSLLEAQGYHRYCQGLFYALPMLSLRGGSASIERIAPGPAADTEQGLLQAHAALGCISLMVTAAGTSHPFVFAPRRRRGVPYALLAYCRDPADLTRFAGPIGRDLARRGFPLVALDADGPVPGLAGLFRARKPKFYRGPDRPRLGDIAYSERALFGV